MSADLQVTIDDGAASVLRGTSDTYAIVVTNDGPHTVSSVTLTDAIPAARLNASFAPSAGGDGRREHFDHQDDCRHIFLAYAVRRRWAS
jgi:uncharacterized repeat protein (TIGR01451 family)